ncbi:hypothetical protein H3Z83_12815, partial [Tenacibaculum sp. S7007]|nr:hypothetical protein [Tenacibaculum pelagium]
YIVTRTYTLKDCGGNETPLVQTIRVEDTTAPKIDSDNLKNIDLECGVGNTVEDLQNWLDNNAGATATDNCTDNDNIKWTNNYGEDTSVKCDGSYINVTFTATDECGNSSTVTAGYLIKDETPPTITKQPTGKTVECDGSGNIDELNAWLANNGGATAEDDCSAVSWSNDFEAINYSCSFIGEVEVVFKAIDGCGNTIDTEKRKFIIEDTIKPEFEGDLPAQEIVASCNDIPAMVDLTATDNCDSNLVVIKSEVISGDQD